MLLGLPGWLILKKSLTFARPGAAAHGADGPHGIPPACGHSQQYLRTRQDRGACPGTKALGAVRNRHSRSGRAGQAVIVGAVDPDVAQRVRREARVDGQHELVNYKVRPDRLGVAAANHEQLGRLVPPAGGTVSWSVCTCACGGFRIADRSTCSRAHLLLPEDTEGEQERRCACRKINRPRRLRNPMDRIRLARMHTC